MAYYNKIGILILNEDKTGFLVCEPGDKYLEKSVTQYLMPGGQLTEDSIEECIKNETKEELDTEVDFKTLKFIGDYIDVAATSPDKDVSIKLYEAKLLGNPKPSSEIGALHWIGKDDISNEKVSPIIRNKIIPDLIKRKIIL